MGRERETKRRGRERDSEGLSEQETGRGRE